MRKRGFPTGVSEFQDRHGKWRLRFRTKGQPTRYFHAPWGTPEAEAELAAFRSGTTLPGLSGVAITRPQPGTVADLVARYYEAADFMQATPAYQRHIRSLLDRFRDLAANERVADCEWTHLEAIILAKAETHPAAARNLRKLLKRLFAFAARLGMISSNPMDLVARLKPQRGKTGFYAWTEADIAKFRSHHALGTRPRLAMELLLWTGQRRSDVVLLGRQHRQGDHFHITQQKTGKALEIKIAPQLIAAISAMPPEECQHLTYLVTNSGKPYSPAGFGNIFRRWCDEAGLPKCAAHGLRKAMARRGADQGGTNQQLKAVGGWTSDEEVTRYTAGANQRDLADTTIDRVAQWESKMANPKSRLANTP